MAQETQILTQKQTAFLEFVAREKVIVKSYYLTGGTPLAAFYLHHRYSEDLDFFTEEKEVNLVYGTVNYETAILSPCPPREDPDHGRGA